MTNNLPCNQTAYKSIRIVYYLTVSRLLQSPQSFSLSTAVHGNSIYRWPVSTALSFPTSIQVLQKESYLLPPVYQSLDSYRPDPHSLYDIDRHHSLYTDWYVTYPEQSPQFHSFQPLLYKCIDCCQCISFSGTSINNHDFHNISSSLFSIIAF